MKKRFLSCILAAVLCGMSLSGCGNGGTQSQEMAENKAEQGNAAEEMETSDDGIVTLRVWSEEAGFPVLTKMIESFKEEYAGQAEFDIILELASDSNNKDVLLNDVHNAADIFPLADDQLSAVVAGGAVCPVEDPERISEANLEEAVEASSVNGILYAYPMTADNGFFMYYDKNYFTEADVQTLDGMLAVAEAAGKQITMD
ncbi:MAG: extracellular solute-binding protein, partial [Lachnospiraceae bacterium]|nr:extracellular solute-binding protein [Lachnospiraceae bacterium]